MGPPGPLGGYGIGVGRKKNGHPLSPIEMVQAVFVCQVGSSLPNEGRKKE